MCGDLFSCYTKFARYILLLYDKVFFRLVVSCEQIDGIAWNCTFKHCGSGDNEWKSIRCWWVFVKDQGMCVRACVLVLPARFVTAVWSAWRETFMG